MLNREITERGGQSPQKGKKAMKDISKEKKEAQEILNKREEEIAKGADTWEEAANFAVKVINARKLLKQIDIYENVMSDEERAQLDGWSAFETDFRALKPIKEKYDFSWNDLKRFMTFTYDGGKRAK